MSVFVAMAFMLVDFTVDFRLSLVSEPKMKHNSRLACQNVPRVSAASLLYINNVHIASNNE